MLIIADIARNATQYFTLSHLILPATIIPIFTDEEVES